jgi:hypothetical protein
MMFDENLPDTDDADKQADTRLSKFPGGQPGNLTIFPAEYPKEYVGIQQRSVSCQR